MGFSLVVSVQCDEWCRPKRWRRLRSFYGGPDALNRTFSSWEKQCPDCKTTRDEVCRLHYDSLAFPIPEVRYYGPGRSGSDDPPDGDGAGPDDEEEKDAFGDVKKKVKNERKRGGTDQTRRKARQRERIKDKAQGPKTRRNKTDVRQQ